MQQHNRGPPAPVTHAQRHRPYVDVLEIEPFKHSLAATRRSGEAGSPSLERQSGVPRR